MNTPEVPRRLALVSVAVLSLCACDDHIDAGPVRAETREVESFDSIDMQGAAKLEIAVGAAPSVTIKGRDAMIDRVVTEVRGDTLYIESKPKDWFFTNSRPRITLQITVPELQSLRLEGGNDVRLTGFAGGESKIKATGAAHIQAQGYLEELTVEMAGAGHGDFSKLIADDAKVTVDGVGSVIVHPRQTLDATMNGVGAILYIGTPREVNTRMNGLGTIGRRDAKDDDDAQEIPEKVDPGPLQPEYDDADHKKKSDSTELI